ncbi:lipoprotein insertase outer membrane protein LolB [Sinimarinibacterium flocculans]|uniref:lipoprotein insertase outer membrane protein LolB n=1 Tax=Sinimarinibacterium flocculans TaxID=985250 RepID=UPI003513AB9B
MIRTLALLLALALAACAPPGAPPGDDPNARLQWDRHREALARVLGFSLQGRLSDGFGRSGELLWRQRADDSFTLQLRGPLGAGAVAIDGDADGVIVRSKDGEHRTDDPQGWMQAALGWTLPLADLRAWTLGLPADGAIDRLVLDAEGRIASLEQHGWTVHYESYQTVGALALPRRLEARSAEVHLRLLIDRWAALDLAAAS